MPVSISINIPLDSDIVAIGDLATTGLIKRTGAGTMSTVVTSAYGESLVNAANAAALTTLIQAGSADRPALLDSGSKLPLSQINPLTATEISNNAITDDGIGDRTVTDATIPTTLGPGKLTQWLTWIASIVKRILGTTDWFNAPPITLTAAAAHVASMSNPHATTAAQVGAISTGATVTINTTDGISGGGSLALNGGSLSLSIPPTIPSDRTFSNNVTINGNLNVAGTTTTFDSVNTSFADLIVQIGRNNTGIAPYVGVQLERGSFVDAWALWNESIDRWGFYTGADTSSLSACPVEASAFYGINFYAPNFDIEAAGTLAIGNVNATTINIGSAATSVNLATGSATTTITLGSSGDTLNVPAGTITGITPTKIGAIATGGAAADIANGAIALTKIANIATATVLGRTAAGTGAVSAIIVPVAAGGTNATNAEDARANLLVADEIIAYNYLKSSGRFAGDSLDPRSQLISGAFAADTYLSPYNGSTAFTSAGKFIHNNTTNGGSAGSLTQSVVDLLAALGRSGGSARYGIEFYVSEFTMGSGTDVLLSGKYLSCISNGMAFAGLRSYVTFMCWIRAFSGSSIIISKDNCLIVNEVLQASDATITVANGWVHILKIIKPDYGYDSAFPRIYANSGTKIQIALMAFFPGWIRTGKHIAPIPTL